MFDCGGETEDDLDNVLECEEVGDIIGEVVKGGNILENTDRFS